MSFRATETYFFSNPVGDLDGLTQGTGLLDVTDPAWLDSQIPSTQAFGMRVVIESIRIVVPAAVPIGMEIWIGDQNTFIPATGNWHLNWQRTTAPIAGADAFSLPDDNSAVLQPIPLRMDRAGVIDYLAIRTFGAGATGVRAYVKAAVARAAPQ